MKKIFTAICILVSLSMSAVTVNEVAGSFKGNLNIAGSQYPNKEVYILPGVESNTITFVLPDFRYNNAPLGDIVLVNIPMDGSGRLTLDKATLFIKAISERAEIDVLNDFTDGSEVYNSVLTASHAQVLLSIAASSLPEPILVLFTGDKVTNENYAVVNGGFEGNWTNGEPEGWHSFNTATGSYVSFVQNTEQFTRQTETRPGSQGSSSAKIQTKIVVGNNANGNCTNGQINAGSMTATDASGNYNFSDPSNTGYNTPFVGNPDSLVFWAKYIPADQNPSNAVNKARAHAVITTNARYQDPEVSDYSSIKIAEAEVNYAATSEMGWQRISVPFNYKSVDPSKAAYMLVTFTSNYTPGGGSSYTSGGLFNKEYHLDDVYLDDVEMVYNHALSSLTLDGTPLSFTDGQAVSELEFSDSAYAVQPQTNGKASQAFVGYDTPNNRILVYAVADNYAQAQAYSVYTVQMEEPKEPEIPPVIVIEDTEYAYEASICANESYSDELFSNLTEEGEYYDTIPNAQGGDSLITFTLHVLPIYSFASEGSIRTDESYAWEGKEYKDLAPGEYRDTVRLKTVAGCDSILTLSLEVRPIGYFFEEELTACQNEEGQWRGQVLPTAQAGSVVLYDSLKSVFGMDSVYKLTLTVHPVYHFEEVLRVTGIDTVWHGIVLKDLPAATEPYHYSDSLKTVFGCDSVFELRVYVSDRPITYGSYEANICEGETVTFEGVEYSSDFSGDIYVAQPNIYGGDSIVHLTVKQQPSYSVDEYLTIKEGDEASWNGWNLSTMAAGKMTLSAYFYTVYDCDSVVTLHLTVEALVLPEGLDELQVSRRTQKVLMNGRLYFIREDETVYDIVGTKIK